jgi:hypothetical protein
MMSRTVAAPAESREPTRGRGAGDVLVLVSDEQSKIVCLPELVHTAGMEFVGVIEGR